MPLRPVRFPPFVTARLPNGAQLLVVTNHEQPVVTISLSVPAGGVYVPEERAGLDDMLAVLITKGTARRTAEQIAEEIESAGGSITASAGPDYLTITVSALAENLERALGLLADVAAGSTVPEREFDLARTQALSALQLELSQPSSIASRAFRRAIYGAHPYGFAATAATIQAITRDDVVAYYQARVRPAGALLVVAGDVDPARVRALATTAFASWRGTPAAPSAPPPVPARTQREIVIVHRPGAVQSNIVAGIPFITPRDAALYPLTLMNRILGDGTDSRLFLILREQRGWTYGAYSGFTQPRGQGTFQATAEVRTPVTDSALGELVRQLERIRTETPPDSEITAARNYITGSFPLSIETPEQVAGAVAAARLRGQPDDFVIRYRERVAAVTPEQMMAAARQHLATDRLAIIVVGDARQIREPLQRLNLGPVRIVSVEGRPISEADLAESARVPWQPARLAAGTARYRVLLQGNPLGEETRTISLGNEGGRGVVTVITATSLGPFLRQHDTTTFDAATMAPIRVRQGGAIQNQPTFVRLDYEGTRVRGAARAPAPGRPTPQERTIDTTLAAGTLDDNQLGVFVLALPYAAGARWSVPVFSSGQGTVRTVTVAVTGEETVTTPAGTFQTWKVEVAGMEQTVNMYISKDERPALIRLELVGAPLAFELTGRN
jgi:predicted Zn-dependent peptidase